MVSSARRRTIARIAGLRSAAAEGAMERTAAMRSGSPVTLQYWIDRQPQQLPQQERERRAKLEKRAWHIECASKGGVARSKGR